MCAKKAKTTKKKIVSAAWKLFYEQGYDNTTVDDIVEKSGTSKGSFYHYFEGKDALLLSLIHIYDVTANEISKLYAVCERGLMYDWCICGGNYSLKNYAASVMPMLLASIRKNNF